MSILNLFFATIISFSVSFLLNKFFLKNLKYLSIKKNKLQSSDRWGESFKSHFGGLSFSICAFLLFLFIASQNITEISQISQEYKSFVGIFFVICISTISGFIDEKETLGPWSKIFNQLIICSILIWAGFTINLTEYFLINVMITTLWFLFIINSFNLFDNVDLALGAYSLTLLIFFLFLSTNIFYSSMLQLLICIYIGSILGFICLNYYPSKIFMGEIGSLQLGSVLSALSVSIIWHEYQPQNMLHTIYYLLLNNVLFLVLFLDVILVFSYRWFLGKNIFKGDTNHLSHRFLKFGYSPNFFALFILLVNLFSFSILLLLAYFEDHYHISLRFLIILMYYLIVMLLLSKIYIYKK